MIPAEAIEAAGEFLPPVWTSNEVYRARLIQSLEAAATHMLSHDREQTRLAHLDAMVNRETKQAELADAWELGMVTMYATTGGEWPLIPEQNPYRSETVSQVIPVGAVEAAAKWLHDIDCRSAFHSGHPADIVCYDWMDEARELLEAAAPHMLAEGLAEAAQQMRDERHTWCLDDVGRYWIKRTLDELAERADNMRPTA